MTDFNLEDLEEIELNFVIGVNVFLPTNLSPEEREANLRKAIRQGFEGALKEVESRPIEDTSVNLGTKAINSEEDEDGPPFY